MREYKVKYCPDLTSYEEVKAMLIGQGDIRRPVLNACIQGKCVAYDHGRCMKYKNDVFYPVVQE